MSRILVAMSGGVDSSVAAALLTSEGHDVTGVHLKLATQVSEQASQPDGRVHGCCSVEAADDARRVAQVLDIPFYVWNLSDIFRRSVVDNFVGEYASGRTPNPCVRCNETVKFGAVLERGLALGFDYVATGHYAKVVHGALDGSLHGAFHDERPSRLYRSADTAKDQSYVLSSIGQKALSRALFPVGAQTKEQTRAVARNLDLRTAEKPESYDICFVPDGDAAGFIRRAEGSTAMPGEILDPDGSVIGEHAGIVGFTVGQRRGLGLATAERRYVLEVDATRNAIIVGPGELLARSGIQARRVVWLEGPPSPSSAVSVQIRAHGRPTAATLTAAGDDQACVRLHEPERGVAPGQLIALYDGDRVLGGGTIVSAER